GDEFPGGRYGRQWQWMANQRPGWTVEHAGDRLRRAVALSTATVLAPAAGEFDRAAYEELLSRVGVEEYAPTTA
ncbi:hypothetical protein AB0P40_37530, partial [Streptomyces sp. NPDC079189]